MRNRIEIFFLSLKKPTHIVDQVADASEPGVALLPPITPIGVNCPIGKVVLLGEQLKSVQLHRGQKSQLAGLIGGGKLTEEALQ